MIRSVLSLALYCALLALPARAETVYAFPSATCGETDAFLAATARLKPGDTLRLGPGVYCQTGKRLIRVSGTAERPVTILGAGPEQTIVTRPTNPRARQGIDGTEFDGAHLVVRGIHFRGGRRGLVFHAGAHHVTVEDNEISWTANNGLTLNNGNTDHFVIRGNHVHHTGNLDPALGGTEGEGMYIGCNNAKCIAHDHLIEDNRIHDLRGTGSGGDDGIEIKYGSYGNTVRNNVIHTIFPAIKDIRYPCIFAYGTLDAQRDRPNVIEGNVLSGCGEAIQVVSDAIVRKNIVLSSQQALATYYHAQVPTQRNLRIEDNTFIGSPLKLEFGVQVAPGHRVRQ
jgi:hypothetical protein